MNEKQTRNIKTLLKCLIATAGVFAIIGGIMLLATIGKLTSSYSSDSLSALTSYTGIYVGLDIARFGGFALFAVTVIYAATEFFEGSPKKNNALIMAGFSLLSFVGCFLTSFSALYNSTLSLATNTIYSGGQYGSSSYEQQAAQMMKRIFAPWTVGGIFFLVSAAAVIIMICATFVKPRIASGYAVSNPYMSYPDQPYPDQQFTNRQYPNQQYPNQPYYGQNTADYQPQDQNNNTTNNFQ